MATITLDDDKQARLTFSSTDAEGVTSVDPSMTVSIDRPDLATLEAPSDPRNGDYVVRRVPGGNGTVTVVVTAALPQAFPFAPITSTSETVIFTPGATTAITCTPVAEPLTTGS